MPFQRLSIGQIIALYLIAVFAVVGGLIAEPNSPLLNALLFLLIFLFLVVAIAVILVAGLYIVSLVALRLGFSALMYVPVRVASWQMNQRSRASDPGGIRLDRAKLRRLCPSEHGGGGIRGRAVHWLDARLGKRAALVFLVDDQLRRGDSRAAVVVSLSPLLVAAYTDELDCVALLRFPDALAGEYHLHLFSRLLTVNRYMAGGTLAPDLLIGPLSLNNYTNFQPFIAEFLSSDTERIRARKAQISEQEWRRAVTLGRRCLEELGTRPRDGRPDACMTPSPT